MMKRLMYLMILILITACGSPTEASAPEPSATLFVSPQATLESATLLPASTEDPASTTSPATAVTDDVFSRMGITLPAPVCTSVT
ncbi:MAG TPA: hypothetical protein VFY26_09240, partial [Anaerolineales bacterium]|nr:hypothetical protein [Anaerolineales bacterium]